MGEIYTDDIIEIAKKYADKISKKINYTGYVIEDECCNLQRDIRKILHERLSKEFRDLIAFDVRVYQKDELKEKLFKIINNL